MSDEKPIINKTTSLGPAKSSTIQCDLHNPTRARRVIYDGIEGNNRAIVVEAGDVKRGVTLHRSVVDELRDREKAKKGSDLVVRPMVTTESTAA